MQVPLTLGENALYFQTENSYLHSDAGGTAFVYVKVWQDIANVAPNAVRAEAALVQTPRYLSGYFGGACCQ